MKIYIIFFIKLLNGLSATNNLTKNFKKQQPENITPIESEENLLENKISEDFYEDSYEYSVEELSQSFYEWVYEIPSEQTPEKETPFQESIENFFSQKKEQVDEVMNRKEKKNNQILEDNSI